MADLSRLMVILIPIFGLAGIGVWVFFLIPTYRRVQKSLDEDLKKKLGDFDRHIDLTSSDNAAERIDGFLKTIQEIVDHPKSTGESNDFYERLKILAESRSQARLPAWFETCHNVMRYSVEAFPLVGILGTILPLGLELTSTGSSSAPADITAAVGNFGSAIWTTFEGLFVAIILGVLNACWEPSFDKLTEQSHALEMVVLEARKKLRLRLDLESTK
jgi:biopolymer transport protein ExbB/TolQ